MLTIMVCQPLAVLQTNHMYGTNKKAGPTSSPTASLASTDALFVPHNASPTSESKYYTTLLATVVAQSSNLPFTPTYFRQVSNINSTTTTIQLYDVPSPTTGSQSNNISSPPLFEHLLEDDGMLCTILYYF
jgi:hypothetical protein